MLQNLTQQQLEQALVWLDSPQVQPYPKELQNLNEVEWMLLSGLLMTLQAEKDNSQVH
jgi:hypothetical protein